MQVPALAPPAGMVTLQRVAPLERDFAAKRDLVASKRLDLYRTYREAKGQGA